MKVISKEEMLKKLEVNPKSEELEKIYERLVDSQHSIHIDSKLIRPNEIAIIFEYITILELTRLETINYINQPTKLEEDLDLIEKALTLWPVSYEKEIIAFTTIRQHIINQQEEIKCNLNLANDWSDKTTKLQSKLSKIEEWTKHAQIDCISRQNLFRIIGDEKK